MATIPNESIDVLRSASQVQVIAASVSSQEELSVAAAVINSAADAGQTSCVIERSLSPSTIQDLIDNGYTLEGLGRADKNIPYIVDWSKFVSKCIAGSYEDISAHSTIYNVNSISSVMWVQLPELAKNFLIDSIGQIQPQSTASLDLTEVTQENIWITIPTSIMDITSGQKIYKIHLTHSQLEDSMTLYFSYTVQDDNPDKSYVYMK